MSDPDELYTDDTNGDMSYIAYVINADPVEAADDAPELPPED